MRNILVGIDPSFVTMGAAIYIPGTGEMSLKTGDMHSVIKWINKSVKMSKCIFIVENPALVSNVFSMWGIMKGHVEDYGTYQAWLARKSMQMPKKVTLTEVSSIFARAMKMAQNVGENKAAAKYFLNLIDGLAPIVEISPTQRDRYDKLKKKLGKNANIDLNSLKFPTKTNQTVFNDWTGYSGRSSEHARDAASLVFGRSIKWAEMMVPDDNKPKSYPSGRNDNFFLVERNKKAQN